MKKIQEAREKIQVSLDPNLLYRVRLEAVKQHLNIREAITKALNDWVTKANF